MSKGFTDRMIDAVIRAHQLEDGATLVPRWCLRWSVNLTVLALGEFLLATLITFARGFYVAGAIVASIGGGWLLVYVLYLAICYVMVYQSQTRLFQSIYRCPFWHGLGVLHRTLPVVILLIASAAGNVVGVSMIIRSFTGDISW